MVKVISYILLYNYMLLLGIFEVIKIDFNYNCYVMNVIYC